MSKEGQEKKRRKKQESTQVAFSLLFMSRNKTG